MTHRRPQTNYKTAEMKRVSEEPVHKTQLLSYLKLHVGLLINFNVKQLKRSLRRLVNELPE